jgi:pimeloyl-ACP methyl ester carboxylesterase
MQNFLLIFFVLFVFQKAFSQSTDCRKSNISSVASKVDVRQPELGTFKYYYQYIKKADESVPTVIVIPGGPGGKSIDLQPENPYFDWVQILYGFMPSYNAILTDPRSIGCNNSSFKFPRDTFTSENVANDIISIITSLKLENYVIYGHSYGTVVATIIGKTASDGLIPPPKAIIISGTLGHYFKNHREEVLPSYSKAWGNLRSLLPESIQNHFPRKDDWSDYSKDNDSTSLLGIPMLSWFRFVFDNLTEGGVYQNGKLIFPILSKLNLLGSQDKDEVSKLKAEVSAYSAVKRSEDSDLSVNQFHDSIWCQELEEKQSPECLAQNYSFRSPFDSKNFQIKNIPIVYIHGEFDLTVPIDKAIYHYSNQLSENKFFLVAKDGGHSTMSVIADCKDLFWKSVFDGAVNLESAVERCIGIQIINSKRPVFTGLSSALTCR